MAGYYVRVTVDTGGLQLAYRADRPTAARYQAAMACDCPQFAVTVELANPYGIPYHFGMADVVTTGEARDALHRIAQQFAAGGGEPVYFGAHRRAQAVIVPVDVWEQLLEQAEDDVDLAISRKRTAGPSLAQPELMAALRAAADSAA